LLGPLLPSKRELGPIINAFPFFISPFPPHPKRVDVHTIFDLLSDNQDDLMKIKKIEVTFRTNMEG
jgi:hypothetical protein